ncbi:unnamed protein product [Brassicogethes aeneus]|uniref:Uncharacterized protein n=1 Tax=Brassicogethes aeneus TaxID=1431903 RepID=A0A9P0AYR4_BRAAE|nr:unnamed protein product [Brassicogethes aeneus]
MVPLIKSQVIAHSAALSSSYYTQTLSKLVSLQTVKTVVPQIQYVEERVPAVEQRVIVQEKQIDHGVPLVSQRVLVPQNSEVPLYREKYGVPFTDDYEATRLGIQYAEKRPYYKKDRGTTGKKWITDFDGISKQVDISAMDLKGVLTPQVPSVSLLSPKGPYNSISNGITEALYDKKTEEAHTLETTSLDGQVKLPHSGPDSEKAGQKSLKVQI